MSYVDGFVIPVPLDRKEDYFRMAARVAPVFKEHGALQVVECWGDDVSDDRSGGFAGAVGAGEGENVVLSWIVWPSKEARDQGNARILADERLKLDGDPLFNPGRMICGGFVPVLNTTK